MSWRLDYEFSGLAVVELDRNTGSAQAHLLAGGASRPHRPSLYVPADCIHNYVSVAGAKRDVFGLSIIPVPDGAYLLEVDVDGSTVHLGASGVVSEFKRSGKSFPQLRTQTPADDDDWGSLAYAMNLAEVFPGSQLNQAAARVKIPLPAGLLRAGRPNLARQEHEKWQVTLANRTQWVQSFASRVLLETEQADGVTIPLTITKAGETLTIEITPIPGRCRNPVTIGVTSECCMASMSREASVTLGDFAGLIAPTPAAFPSVMGTANYECGGRPMCNGALFLA